MDFTHWIAQCYREAAASPDRSTQNGAIILWGEMPVSFACNRFPRGVDPGDDRVHEPALKRRLIVHAERMAIYEAARRQGLQVRTGRPVTMVAPWAACPECAQAIIQAGITRLVVHEDRLDQTPDRWKLDVELGLKMCRDAGVDIVTVQGPVDAQVTIRFDGKDIHV